MEGREGGGGRAFSGEIEEGGRKKNDGRPRAPGRGRRRASMSRHRIVHPRANTAFAWTYAIGITRGCAVASIASGAQRAAASALAQLAKNKDNQHAIVAAGGVPVLLDLLREERV